MGGRGWSVGVARKSQLLLPTHDARVCLGPIPYPRCDRECYRTDEVGLAKGARAWVRATESLIVRSYRGLYVQGAWWLGAWQARYEEMSPILIGRTSRRVDTCL